MLKKEIIFNSEVFFIILLYYVVITMSSFFLTGHYNLSNIHINLRITCKTFVTGKKNSSFDLQNDVNLAWSRIKKNSYCVWFSDERESSVSCRSAGFAVLPRTPRRDGRLLCGWQCKTGSKAVTLFRGQYAKVRVPLDETDPLAQFVLRAIGSNSAQTFSSIFIPLPTPRETNYALRLRHLLRRISFSSQFTLVSRNWLNRHLDRSWKQERAKHVIRNVKRNSRTRGLKTRRSYPHYLGKAGVRSDTSAAWLSCHPVFNGRRGPPSIARRIDGRPIITSRAIIAPARICSLARMGLRMPQRRTVVSSSIQHETSGDSLPLVSEE